MPVPSKKDQIAAVVDFLDDDTGKSLTEIATEIVQGMYKMWERGIEDPPIELTEGRKFKVPWSSSIHTITWLGECKYMRVGEVRDCVWVTDGGTGIGSLTLKDAPFWRLAIPSTSKTEPKANALGLKVGTPISHGQGLHKFTVLATTEKAALFSSVKDPLRIYADKNDIIEKFYKWER